MKLISWNVNGLRAAFRKGFDVFFTEAEADIVCLQEIKMQEGQLDFNPEGYHSYYNYAEKKGYSGTAVFTKKEPIAVRYGMGIAEHDTEGRLITLEFDAYFVVTVYTPNSQHGLLRLDYRLAWEKAFLAYIKELDTEKPVIFCGDLNVAHEEIDLKNPKANLKNSGFTAEERGRFSAILNEGFIDTYRYFYPEKKESYTWWSYRTNCRERNIGWRIDYVLVSSRLVSRLQGADILSDIKGSDHCPVELQLDL